MSDLKFSYNKVNPFTVFSSTFRVKFTEIADCVIVTLYQVTRICDVVLLKLVVLLKMTIVFLLLFRLI